MLKVGITGGIGSGKSLVSKILETFSYPVFYSDQVAKDIINNHLEVKAELVQLIGPEVFIGANLNRQYLANIIFNDEKVREQVNAIVHPRVRAAFIDFVQKQESNLVFNEAAILIESEGYRDLDKTVLVIAPEDLRISRVMSRDQISKDEVRSRIQNQWSDTQKIEYADFVIVNNEIEPLLIQVEELVDQLSSSKSSK